MAEEKILAEVSGRISSLAFGVGDKVEAGQEVAIIEAMKMEIPLTSPVSGTVVSLLRQSDDMINEGDPIISIDVD
jgi:biotin carboxyl carrier protein